MSDPSIVCYTAIFDEYDILFDPRERPANVDFVCFSDADTLRSDVWKCLKPPRRDLPPNLQNRLVKVLPHRFFDGYDYSVYVDGNVQILGDVSELVDRYLSSAPMACPRHPNRDCAYAEATACIEAGVGDAEAIREQMDRYRDAGFPEHAGLPENSILLRDHEDPTVMATMETWWDELRTHSTRDQLSFPFVAWQHDLEYIYMDESGRRESDYFRPHPHRPPGLRGCLFVPWIHLRANRDQNRLTSLLYRAGRRLGKNLAIDYPGQ